MLLASGITTNQVCGAIASAMLADLNVNNFSFQGFPEIQVTYGAKAFQITLRAGDAVVGPFSLNDKEGTKQARRFSETDSVTDSFHNAVQGWIVELESAGQ